jgi:hypothetical protein
VRDNLSHQTTQAVRDNPSYLTNFHLINRLWSQIYEEENSYSKQKQQPTNNSSGHGGYKRHNMEVDRLMRRDQNC